MSARVMQVEVLTPAGSRVYDDVVRMRFEASDGSRGVLPGHERSRSVVAAGAVEIVRVDGKVTYVACEEGLASIRPGLVQIVSPWAAEADALSVLHLRVADRARDREVVEGEARAVARRHETATQRALVGLRREVES